MGIQTQGVSYIGSGSLLKRIIGTGTLLLSGLIASAGNQNTQSDQGYDKQHTNTPQAARIFPGILGANMHQGLSEISKVLPKEDYGKELSQIKGFGQRQDYINNLLKEVNPQLLPTLLHSNTPTALAEFNRKNNMNLTCLGIKRLLREGFNDHFEWGSVVTGQELVFVDMDYFTGRNNIPVRIGINFSEAAGTQGKSNVLNLLEQKLNEHKKAMKNQYAIWTQPYEFSFTPNRGACMLVLEQYPLRGMETDLVSSLRSYTGRYGMTVNSMCVGNFHENGLKELLQSENIKGLPEFSTAAKKSILENLEKSLQKAINDGKSYFVFHYFLHGSHDGTIWTEHEAISPEDFAKVISKPYGLQGRPLCDQIDIFVWAASCYSGQQIKGIKTYFENNRNIPVRNLRIIAEADNTSSWTQAADKMSLATSLPIMSDTSGITDFYSAVFDEYQNELASRGVRIDDRARSYLWKVRFIDLMAKADSTESQDMLGFHFSNNPNYDKLFERQFTQIQPQISENPDLSNAYAQLKELKDTTPESEWREYINNLRNSINIA